MKKSQKLYFKKIFKMNFQNFQKKKKSQEFQKTRFSFDQQKILHLTQDLRQMISLKA